MKKIIVFGAGEFADIVYYYFTHDTDIEVAAFTVEPSYIGEESFNGLPVIPFDEAERRYPPSEYGMFVAIGYRNVNRDRAAKVAAAHAKGYQLASYLSTKASVPSGLTYGPNTFVMEHAVIEPYVQIGRDVIIWGSSKIGYRSRISDHCWITCAVLGAAVELGDHAFIGLDAMVASYVSVGTGTVVGAGATILKDTRSCVTSTTLARRNSRTRRILKIAVGKISSRSKVVLMSDASSPTTSSRSAAEAPVNSIPMSCSLTLRDSPPQL